MTKPAALTALQPLVLSVHLHRLAARATQRRHAPVLSLCFLPVFLRL